MKGRRLVRVLQLVASGVIMLQTGSCLAFNEFAQTILLGVTAAGAIVIIDNI